MDQPSVRRAVFSWLLLLLIAVGIGWFTAQREGRDVVPAPAGFSSLTADSSVEASRR